MKLTNIFKKTLKPLRTPRDNSTFNSFMTGYGWVFTNSDKTTGDYSLYRLATQNVYITRCIEIISEGLLTNGFSINNPDEEEPDQFEKKYLENVFESPGGLGSAMTYAMFHHQYITAYKLTGDAFIEVNYDEDINTLDGFTFVPGELLRWFNDTEQWGFRDRPSLRYENDELIHIYKPGIDIKHLHYGESVLEQLRHPIRMLYYGLDYNEKLLENDGLDPHAILSFDKDMDDFSFNAELDRLNEAKKHRKKGGTLAIKGGIFQSNAKSNTDMDFLNLMHMARDMIITRYGLQPAKLGIIETANLGSGSGESQDKMFKDTLSANATIIEGAFNKVLGRNGFNELFQFEPLDIENKLTRAQIEQIQVNSNVKTVNEIRSEYGLTPVEWGDVPANNRSANPMMGNDPYASFLNTKSLSHYKNKILKADLMQEWRRP